MTKLCPKKLLVFSFSLILTTVFFLLPMLLKTAEAAITASPSGSSVTFNWNAQPNVGVIDVWTASSPEACVNVNSPDKIYRSPQLPAGTTTFTWTSAPDGTYKATFSQYTAVPFPEGCTGSFTVSGGGGGGGGFTIDLNTQLAGKLPTFGPAAVVTFIVQILIVAAFIIAFIFLLLGGIRWITAGGDEKAIAGARGMITGALIGLIVVLAAFTIIKLIEYFFSVNIISGPLSIPKIV